MRVGNQKTSINNNVMAIEQICVLDSVSEIFAATKHVSMPSLLVIFLQ